LCGGDWGGGLEEEDGLRSGEGCGCKEERKKERNERKGGGERGEIDDL
jgi:hypothetical protein